MRGSGAAEATVTRREDPKLCKDRKASSTLGSPDVLSENRTSLWGTASAEEHYAHVENGTTIPRADPDTGSWQETQAGGPSCNSHVAGLVRTSSRRHVSTRRTGRTTNYRCCGLRRWCASSTGQGRRGGTDPTSPPRALRARTLSRLWADRAVGEGVNAVVSESRMWGVPVPGSMRGDVGNGAMVEPLSPADEGRRAPDMVSLQPTRPSRLYPKPKFFRVRYLSAVPQ